MLCGGSLISPHLVLSSYHCSYNMDLDSGNKPCNHRDGKRVAIIGEDKIDIEKAEHGNFYCSIPVTKVIYPDTRNKNMREDPKNLNAHDMAVFVLKHAVLDSFCVASICLPPPNLNLTHLWRKGHLVGWKHANDAKNPNLRELVETRLEVGQYSKYEKMVKTQERKPNGAFHSTCPGESGN